MGTETNKEDRNTPEYLAQLLKDKKQIQALPNVFVHVDKLLDEGKFSLIITRQTLITKLCDFLVLLFFYFVSRPLFC